MLETLRSQMPVAAEIAYFDHAAVAPLSAPARRRLAEYADDCASHGDLHWPQWAAEIDRLRDVAARLIGAAPTELAWVANTTAGIGLIAEGLPWRDGDNVVLLSNEFPSNQYPWMNLATRQVQTRRVTPRAAQWQVDELLAACDPRTRVIAVSWVGYASGFRCDLDQLVAAAHDRGILVFLDAIQGLGVFPLDVRQTPVDFLAADGHKWMLGPEGAGILYVRQQHLEQLRPLLVGWNSVTQRHDYSHVALEFRAEAARYEGGSQNMPGVLALGASLELLVRCGAGPQQSLVGDHVLQAAAELTEQLRQRGAVVHSPVGQPHGSGIVSFELPGQDPAEVRRHCLQRHVVISCRNGRLRASPHAYTNSDDIQRLCDAVAG